jgi:AcrR family transcriptional regulator
LEVRPLVEGKTVEKTRAMRSDARRNREGLIAAAREVFGRDGTDASLDEIAQRAGVGPGTLYRHFPTRAALIEAVYRDAVEELCADAQNLAVAAPPGEALAEWMHHTVAFTAEKIGLMTALKESLDPGSEVFSYCRTKLYDAAAAILEPAQKAGIARPDLNPRDLMLMAHSVSVVAGLDAAAADRMLTVVLDGLHPR